MSDILCAEIDEVLSTALGFLPAEIFILIREEVYRQNREEACRQQLEECRRDPRLREFNFGCIVEDFADTEFNQLVDWVRNTNERSGQRMQVFEYLAEKCGPLKGLKASAMRDIVLTFTSVDRRICALIIMAMRICTKDAQEYFALIDMFETMTSERHDEWLLRWLATRFPKSAEAEALYRLRAIAKARGLPAPIAIDKDIVDYLL